MGESTQQILDALTARGMRLEDIAARTGASLTAVRNWRDGASEPIAVFERALAALVAETEPEKTQEKR